MRASFTVLGKDEHPAFQGGMGCSRLGLRPCPPLCSPERKTVRVPRQANKFGSVGLDRFGEDTSCRRDPSYILDF